MKDLMKKYAQVLLKTCLKIKENQPLLIYCNTERMDFVEIVNEEALKLGVNDIYLDLYDANIKHAIYKYLDTEDIKKHQYYNHEKWNEYAKKNGAFLMLVAETPGLMKDIDATKIKEVGVYSLSTRKEFDDLRDKSIVPWCIAAVPTKLWADLLFPNSTNSVDELWHKIFEICHIKDESPVDVWNEKISKLKERANKLNSYQFKKLLYKSSNGTNFEIGLPENHIWASGGEKLKNGEVVLVNFPTEEVFTSPKFDTAKGIVYSSKPLSYQANIINDFWLKFENGKVIDFDAKEGKEILKELISTCKNNDYLGEVALVENDSPISNSKIVFYETLFDENASCHLALGASFPECIENGTNLSKDELKKLGMNICDNHVDFMIGTKDLSIIGVTKDNKEIPIFVDGNFDKLFK